MKVHTNLLRSGNRLRPYWKRTWGLQVHNASGSCPMPKCCCSKTLFLNLSILRALGQFFPTQNYLQKEFGIQGKASVVQTVKITFLISPDGLERTFRQHTLKISFKFPRKIYCGILAHLWHFLTLCWNDAVNWKMSYWGQFFILPHLEFWSQSNESDVVNSSKFTLGHWRSDWTVISKAAWEQPAGVEYLSCLHALCLLLLYFFF